MSLFSWPGPTEHPLKALPDSSFIFSPRRGSGGQHRLILCLSYVLQIEGARCLFQVISALASLMLVAIVRARPAPPPRMPPYRNPLWLTAGRERSHHRRHLYQQIFELLCAHHFLVFQNDLFFERKVKSPPTQTSEEFQGGSSGL